VAPLPGGSDDPRLAGATLEIGNPATGEWARFSFPAGGWLLNGLGTVFRYQGGRPRGVGTVRALVLRHNRRLKVHGTAIGLSLDEAAQGRLAVLLTTGSRRYCMLFADAAVKRDQPRRFAARNSPAPSACQAPPVATSTTSTSNPPRLLTSTSTSTSTTRTTSTVPGQTTSTSSVDHRHHLVEHQLDACPDDDQHPVPIDHLDVDHHDQDDEHVDLHDLHVDVVHLDHDGPLHVRRRPLLWRHLSVPGQMRRRPVHPLPLRGDRGLSLPCADA
jgi:hypothetical protein